MKRARIVRIVGIVVGAACLLWPAELVGRISGPDFQLVGPPETAELEGALSKRLGVYAWGIWPRAEKLEKAIAGPNLPKEYVQRIQTWVETILSKDLFPKAMDPNQWYGLLKANGYNDFIVGQWQNAKGTVRVQFRATGLLLVVTATSKQYFPDGPAGLTDQQIINAITALVNYPEEKVKDIAIEKHFEQMGDPNNRVLVCYGKLMDRQYDGTKAPLPDGTNMPIWWNHMTFWVTKNKIFFSSSTVNWESFPASLDPYVFKLSASTERAEK